MKDEDKPKEQLINELAEMRQRMAELEAAKTKQVESLLRTLANGSMVGIYIVQEGKFQFVNPQFQKYVGYSEDELLGMDSSLLVLPDDRNMVRENAVRMLKGERSSPYEFRFVSKAGENKWVIETVTSIQYQGRQAALGSFMDISDRKRAEGELKTAQEYARNLIDSSLDMIVAVDQERRIIEFNPAAQKVFGYSEAEVLGKHIDILYVDSSEGLKPHETIQRTGQFIGEIVNKRKNGKTFPAFLAASALQDEDGNFLGVMGVSRDITERRRVEEERVTALKMASDVMEAMLDAVIVTNMESKIIEANRAALELTGYTKEELIGKTPLETVISEEEQPRFFEMFPKLFSGESIPAIEYQAKRKDGGTISALLSLSVLKDAQGKPSAIVAVNKDITERKQAEEKLRGLYEQETKLRQELEAEMMRRVAFARALVHELKTPLTPMMVASEFLVAELQDGPLLRLAKNINRGASNLNNRIDELLDLARGEIGMLHLEPKSADLLQLLQRVVDDIAPLTSSHGQSLIPDLPPSLPLVWADESRLRQVVLNLLSNASKFTPDGGKITLKAVEKDAALIVEVQDTGHGVAQEEQQRLFQPYYQVESDRERSTGLGLGLALCKILVELHGGRIWVESYVGKGSTFGFSVPLEAVGGSRQKAPKNE